MLEIRPDDSGETRIRYRIIEESAAQDYVERTSAIVHDGLFDENYNTHETIGSVWVLSPEEAVAEIAAISGLGQDDALNSLLESGANPNEPGVYHIYTRHITETRDDIDSACERAAYLSAVLDNTFAMVTETQECSQQWLLSYEDGDVIDVDFEEHLEDA